MTIEDQIVLLLLARAAQAVFEDDFENYRKCGQALCTLTGLPADEIAAAISSVIVSKDEGDEFAESVLADIEAL